MDLYCSENEVKSDTNCKMWDFNRYLDFEGWVLPNKVKAFVSGGAINLSFKRDLVISDIKDNVFPAGNVEITSPRKLGIDSANARKVKINLMNLSPETDGEVRWTTSEKPHEVAGIARFSIKPDCKEWQEVVCHMDETKWCGTLDRISIKLGMLGHRGDMWIDRIAITGGQRRKLPERPDVRSDKVVPQIDIPGISQSDFQMAFDVMDEALVVDVPSKGFEYPFMGPGGEYGYCWWQLDTSLALAGAKWVNKEFSENVIRGFIGVQLQNPDGRIDLWGGSPIRGSIGELSSLPRYFEAAYDIARRTADSTLIRDIYKSMCLYLKWWLSPIKRDKTTGLVMGFFEETFGCIHPQPQNVAQVDLNIAVALGCLYSARLAGYLGEKEEEEKYNEVFGEFITAINEYMWDEEKGAYYSYNIIEKKHVNILNCATFDTLRHAIANPERIEKLISKLTDPDLFNWGKIPMTSIAKTDPKYLEAKGTYDGRAWYGDVWTLRNMSVISGLHDIGRYGLAAELNWKTIQIFNAKYCEFLEPTKGEGHGVQRYVWSASQYIQGIIECLFGIDYDRIAGRLRIMPHIPETLRGKSISIKNLILPTGSNSRLDMRIYYERDKLTINISLFGSLSDETVEIIHATGNGSISKIIDADSGTELNITDQFDGIKSAVGIKIQMRKVINLIFCIEEGF